MSHSRDICPTDSHVGGAVPHTRISLRDSREKSPECGTYRARSTLQHFMEPFFDRANLVCYYLLSKARFQLLLLNYFTR